MLIGALLAPEPSCDGWEGTFLRLVSRVMMLTVTKAAFQYTVMCMWWT